MADEIKGKEGQDQSQDKDKQQQGGGEQQQQQQNMQLTEAQVQLLLAEKKVSAKNEFLKSLGFDGDEEGLKETLKRVMDEDEKNQTELQKVQKELSKITKVLAQEQALRKSAESKLEALKLGAKPETVDDLVILASAKMTDDGDLQKVIGGLKKTYPVYFNAEDSGEDDNADPGTKGHISGKDVEGKGKSGEGDGSQGKGKEGGQKGKDNNGGEKSLAERLLAGRISSGKSSYFKNK